MLMVLKIIGFELVAGVSLNYEKNICDRSSMFEKAILRFEMQLRDIIHYSNCLILMEHCNKIAPVPTSALFWTP